MGSSDKMQAYGGLLDSDKICQIEEKITKAHQRLNIQKFIIILLIIVVVILFAIK